MAEGLVAELLESVRAEYLRKAWENLGDVKMSFGDATLAAFHSLARPDPELRIRVVNSTTGWRTLFTLHREQSVPWFDATDNPDLVEMLREVLASDPEPAVTSHDSTDVGGLHMPTASFEFVLGIKMAPYYPQQWALPFLRHIFINPDEWYQADHQHAVNVLWGVLKDCPMPAAQRVFQKLEQMVETGATVEVWKEVLGLLSPD